MKTDPKWILALSLALPATPAALAQQAEQELEVLTVVGSRRQDRSAADSPVPVDIIGTAELRELGDTDMDTLLATLVPSYNVNQQPISDAATLVRPANLRGLSSDATLVLVNGKRRHRAAVISFLGGGVSDGSQGPDLYAIPAIALDRVEILRDGASAQYGSDAIAGVINFVLKEANRGGSMEARWGRHYEGDGDTGVIAANVGLPLTSVGFVNLSAELRRADATSRSVQRADAAALIAAGNTSVRQPAAQVWGAPEFRDDIKLFANLGLEIGQSSELYAFGNWAERTVEGGFYYRNPHTRPGVFSVDGGQTLLVADLSADGRSGNCPTVPVVNNVPDAGALAMVSAAADCFAFIERFPGGFTPRFGGDVSDASLALGVRGNLDNAWFYDLSVVYGRSEARFFINNTINPQLARQRHDIPTSYAPGAYTETDRVVDFSLSKPIDAFGLPAPLYLALGLEYRDETFEIEAGDQNSRFIDQRLASQGFGIGSNGFPGFQPRDAGENKRSSYAAYIDGETQLTDDVLVGAAIRYEDYDDFGSTLDGKLTTRVQLTPNFALRGSVSTGFRAPTVGQANVRNVTTSFSDGVLADQATLPPTHPISIRKGGAALQPEESMNVTLGAVFSIDDLDVTLDYYRITIEGRVAQTSPLPLTEADKAALLALGVADASSFTDVKFFTNDFDTTTSGVDLIATLPLELPAGTTNLIFVANRSATVVDKRNPEIIQDLRVRELEKALPHNRLTLTANHLRGNLRLLGRVRRYAKFFGATADQAPWGATFEQRWLVDAEAAYTFNDAFTVTLGAQNLLDEYPQEDHPDAQAALGSRYPESSPYGFNGGFYYLRANWDFN